jgi:hypothetical protein
MLLALSFALSACDYTGGGVEQGRAIAFESGKKMTVVLDTSTVRNKPVYNGKIVTYKVPTESMDMGPAPVCGRLLAVNPDKKTVSIYDSASVSVKEILVEFTDVQKDIDDRHPLVAGKIFPMIDREKQTVTVYAPPLRSILTFNPGVAIFMPAEAWKFGDEMRIAFRNRNAEETQAIRIMNVSKTNIFRR